VLLSVEAISPERTLVVIGHVVAFAIDTLKRVRAWQALGGFKSRGFKFWISFVTPC